MKATKTGALFLLALYCGLTTANAAESCKRNARDLQPIIATHTAPPYQENRLGFPVIELVVTVGENGRVQNIVVEKSSGSQQHDAAAVAHVKNHWRWKPSRKGCAVTKISITY